MKIRRRKMASRTVFQADIFDATGKRIRKSFRTKGEAEAVARRAEDRSGQAAAGGLPAPQHHAAGVVERVGAAADGDHRSEYA